MQKTQSGESEAQAMNEPKSLTRVESQRLVREFLDAFNSLKTISPTPVCLSPVEEEQQAPLHPLEQSHENPRNTFELLADSQLRMLADPPPMLGTPLQALM